jgi:hypothetical protein
MGPWKDLGTRNCVLGHRPAPVLPKSGEPAAVSSRAWAGKGLRVLGARFSGFLGAESSPARSCGGDGCCQPWYALLWQSGATTAAKGERRASVGARGGAGAVGRVWGRAQDRVPRRRPRWTGGGQAVARAGSTRAQTGSVLLYMDWCSCVKSRRSKRGRPRQAACPVGSAGSACTVRVAVRHGEALTSRRATLGGREPREGAHGGAGWRYAVTRARPAHRPARHRVPQHFIPTATV